MPSLFNILLPKKKIRAGGASATPSYDPQSNTGVVTAPLYREHLSDLFDQRFVLDSQDLIKDLLKSDTDLSATVNAYLTMADTDAVIVARDLEGVIDRDETKATYDTIRLMTRPYDYTQGYVYRESLSNLTASIRTYLMMRGACAAELVYDKAQLPSSLRLIDPKSIEWVEKKAGEFKPQQKVGGGDPIKLDIPNFFYSMFRRDPTNIYPYSPFVSAINTIAARQQVINELYRIMQVTGYPRITIKVMEDILMKNAPTSTREDPAKLRQWTGERLGEIGGRFATLRSDQAFIHTDAVEVGTINDKTPGAGLNMTSVIETLNAQNQAGLKAMSTVIGRGDSGVNTASVEARIAAMNADQLNKPVAELLSNVLSFASHSRGFAGYVDVRFRSAELRPDLELENHKTMRAARLRQDLSDGLIGDDDYHLEIYGRIRPDASPELMGSKFMNPAPMESQAVDASGPIDRAMKPEGGDQVKSNTVKK